MIDLVLATTNKNKIKEIRDLLKDFPINVIGLDNSDWEIPEIIEDGSTFSENSLKKAKTVAKITGKMTMADDSGLEVDAISGKPGIYSARFAGERATDRENNIKLLELLKDIPRAGRSAQFKCVIAIIDSEGNEEIIEGTCLGSIGFSEEGSNGFGYDPIFIPLGYNKTFAQLDMSIKNKISHRGQALEKAKMLLERVVLQDTSRG